MGDTLEIFGQTYTDVAGIKAYDDNGNLITYTRDGSGRIIITDTIDAAGGTIRQINAQTLEDIERDDLTVPKDVDIIDYDGRLLYSYTAEEFLELSALPANPTNPGLVAQGWNWTLADAKAFVGQYGALVIGQSYTTDDGTTKIYVTIPGDFARLRRGFILCINLDTTNYSGTTYTVDWGDNTDIDVVTTGTQTPTHYYESPGKYVIRINVVYGKINLGYYGANHGLCYNSFPEKITVDKVEIGDGAQAFARQAFIDLIHMKSVSIPITCTGIDQTTSSTMFNSYKLTGLVFPTGFVGRDKMMFSSGTSPSLKYVSLPKSTTRFMMEAYPRNLRKFIMYSQEPTTITHSGMHLYDCTSLTHFIVPGTYTTINGDTCRSSYIKKLIIPATVTSIAANAFAYNGMLEEIHLLPTTPPTLANISAFNSQNSDTNTCIFYVPYSANHSILEAYQTATNWSTFASKMQEEPQ